MLNFISLILIFGLAIIPSSPAHAEKSKTPQNSPSSTRITLPNTTNLPRSKNQTRPAGKLSGSKSNACPAELAQLTALVPTENLPHPPLTQAEAFALLVYVPNVEKTPLTGQFWINSRDEKVRIYPKQSVALPTTSGIIALQFPPTLKDQLQVGENYHWFFEVQCGETDAKQVHGWLQVYSPQGGTTGNALTIWYDDLAQTAIALQQDPSNSEKQTQWQKLLDSINQNGLKDSPVTVIQIPN
ncbi:MAG: DUF928 domain-containing protein [Synechocystis sp.]|nr:DUF928 domain-containing protein [Synechocystis sp.]